MHVAVNKYDFEKINILEYAFGEGGGGHQKAYAVYAFINVDNCERPLTEVIHVTKFNTKMLRCVKFKKDNALQCVDGDSYSSSSLIRTRSTIEHFKYNSVT